MLSRNSNLNVPKLVMVQSRAAKTILSEKCTRYFFILALVIIDISYLLAKNTRAIPSAPEEIFYNKLRHGGYLLQDDMKAFYPRPSLP